MTGSDDGELRNEDATNSLQQIWRSFEGRGLGWTGLWLFVRLVVGLRGTMARYGLNHLDEAQQ